MSGGTTLKACNARDQHHVQQEGEDGVLSE